jgi:hypothetical protein
LGFGKFRKSEYSPAIGQFGAWKKKGVGITKKKILWMFSTQIKKSAMPTETKKKFNVT